MSDLVIHSHTRSWLHVFFADKAKGEGRQIRAGLVESIVFDTPRVGASALSRALKKSGAELFLATERIRAIIPTTSKEAHLVEKYQQHCARARCLTLRKEATPGHTQEIPNLVWGSHP